MIIDAHCHVWPDDLAARLIAARPAGLDPVGNGTLSGLLRTMDEAGIDLACTLAVANEARHVARTNAFIGEVDRTRFIPCGTVHTGLSVEKNLRHLRDNGIVAVKFHPNFQGISLASPATLELFTALAEGGYPVLAHVGHGSDAAASERGDTRHVATVVDAVPGLRFVAFHLGGYHDLEGSAAATVGDRRVHLETSWPPALSDLGPERVREIITAHGADRVVLGSDWPMADPAAEIAFIRSLGLDAVHEKAILGDNLAELLGLETSAQAVSPAAAPIQPQPAEGDFS